MRKLFSVLRSVRASRFLRSSLLPVALFFLAFSSVAAKADTIDYTFSGYQTEITFSLDSHGQGATLLNGALVFPNVTAIYNGDTSSVWSVLFAPPDSSLPFYLDLPGIIGWFDFDNTEGNVYFTNDAGLITLNTGTFTIDTYWTLTAIDAAATAVTSEPSSLLLLATGIMGMAFFFRRRSFDSANAIA